MKRIYSIVNNTPKKIIYFSIFCLFLVGLLVQGIDEYWWDSGYYWNLSQSFIKNGQFSIANYDAPLRGYIIPFISLIIKAIGQLLGVKAEVVFLVFSATNFTLISCILFPKSVEIFKRKVNNSSIILFSVILAIYWGGYFRYPLSDISSLVFIWVFLYIHLYIIKIVGEVKQLTIWHFGLILVGMACFGLGMNARPSYQVLIPIVIVIYVYIGIKLKKHKLDIIRIISVAVLGVIIALGPQYYNNVNNYDIASPLVQTQLNYGGESLILKQINWGLIYQKYETYVGPGYVPRVAYEDLNGVELLKKTDNGTISSISEWIKMFLEYPLDFIGVYARHLFNAIDLKYNTPYIKDMNQTSGLFNIFNYTIWFVSIYICVYNVKKWWKQNPFLSFLVGMVMVLSTLIAIVGAVENRFLLPTFIFVYSIFCCFVFENDCLKTLKKMVDIKNGVLFLAFLTICISYSSLVQATIIDHPLYLIKSTNVQGINIDKPETITDSIYSNGKVIQSFIADHNNLNTIGVRLATYGRVNESNVFINLYNSNMELIRNLAIKAHDIIDSQFYDFIFEPIVDSKGKVYYLEIVADGDENNSITVWKTHKDEYIDGICKQDNKEIEGDLNIRIMYKK